jgi:hypothetical protein
VATTGAAYDPLETLDDRARTLAELREILTEVGSDLTHSSAPSPSRTDAGNGECRPPRAARHIFDIMLGSASRDRPIHPFDPSAPQIGPAG